ncbi:hypothetical protein PPACK8108_LOCUS21388 [Phakopsora pachyrhizi]|uniref:Uncharacterized protein n=1 Tax=Phakopsora pachyrhizi TaxID=170000 RepID=A0AAV0BHK9_PHAPC|nr:hypothetical protein PPACK8108_LOCUS21388 [Phakopsora pachyrhizi]
MSSNSPEMTNLKATETSNFNQASSTTLEEDPYIKRGNKSIHTETGKHLNNALQSPTQSPRMTRLQGCVLLKLSTPFILTGPSESSASKPYHLNHLSTLCSVSSSSAWLGHIHQLADLRLRLESTLATLREIYQVRGLGDGQGLGLTDQIPGIVDGQISQVQSDCNSLEIPSLSWSACHQEWCQTSWNYYRPIWLQPCLPTRASVRQQQGTLSETFFRQRLRGLRYNWRIDWMINDANQSIHRLKLLRYISALTVQRIPRKLTRLVGGTETLSPVVASELLERYMSSVSPNLICSYRSLSQPSNLTPGDGEDLLPAIVLSAHYNSKAGFGDLFAPGADNNAL